MEKDLRQEKLFNGDGTLTKVGVKTHQETQKRKQQRSSRSSKRRSYSSASSGRRSSIYNPLEMEDELNE